MTNIDYSLEYEWPLCKVGGCQNNTCLKLESDRCYPHSLGLPKNIFEQKFIKNTNNHENITCSAAWKEEK